MVMWYHPVCPFVWDTADDRDVTMLFKKIKSGQFYIPSHLSTEVVDLISQMLQVGSP